MMHRRRGNPAADKDTLARTARHEAGHAVMALALGSHVEYAIVRRDGDGCVSESHGRGKRDPFVTGLVAWAGSIAEGQDGIQPDDLRPMKRAGLRATSIGTMRSLAKQVFASARLGPALDAVAALLLERVGRRVPGADVRAAALPLAPWLADVPPIDGPRCRYCARWIGSSAAERPCPDRKAGPCVFGRRRARAKKSARRG